MIRKGLMILLIGFMVSVLFMTGCSGSDKKSTTYNPEEEVTLVVGGWPAGDDAFKAIMPAFNELYPNITIELEFKQSADHHQQLSTALAAGTGAADVTMLEQAWIGRYKDSGGFENLLDAPYNAGDMKNDFVQYKWDLATSVDGTKTIGLVWDIGPATLFYRTDIFEEAGLPTSPEEVEKYLSTWEGVLDAAEKVYIPNERWLLPNAYYLYTWNYMNRDFYNEKLELVLDKPGSKEALEAAIVMRENGWDAQLPSMWDNEAYAGLSSGNLAMVVAGCWYGGFLKSWIAPDTEGLWGVARIPGGIEDSNWGGSYLAIPSQSKHTMAAWEFIKYSLATNEGQNGMFEAVDYFPGYKPAWDDSMYTAADPFFGGQKVRSLWVDISKSIKPTISTLMDSTTENTLSNAVNTGINEGWEAEKIIEEAKKQIEIAIREDKEKYIDILKDADLWK